MNTIRPISDLRNNWTEIDNIIEQNKPVFLTKNGYGKMVVMSMEAYENKLFESEVYSKLLEAHEHSKISNKRHSQNEVFQAMREIVRNNSNV